MGQLILRWKKSLAVSCGGLVLRKANEEPADGFGCVLLPSLLLRALDLVSGLLHSSVGQPWLCEGVGDGLGCS